MGWLAASVRSMMLKRLCPKNTGISTQVEELSGPRCRMDSSIFFNRQSPRSRVRAESIMPAMPHIDESPISKPQKSAGVHALDRTSDDGLARLIEDPLRGVVSQALSIPL